MKIRNMLPFRRRTWLSIALLSSSFAAASDPLFQTYCSSDNTGSDYSVVTDYWQSNGACHDNCLYNGNYAFAIVQYQSCWCSNYAPANTVSVSSDCAVPCPGYPAELCGNQDSGYFGYIALDSAPSGTVGAGGSAPSTSNSPTSTATSSSGDPETSYVSRTVVQTVTQTPDETVVTSLVTPSSQSTSTQTSKSRSSTTPAPVVPVTSTIVQTISGSVVTQTVTSTPIIAPNSNPDSVQIQRQTGLSSGAVAGIVVGVVGGLVILALIAFLLWRRRKSNSDNNAPASSVAGSNRNMTRNVSVLSKSGLLARARGISMSERDHDDGFYIPPPTGSNSVRHSMMFGGGGAVDPTSPLDSSHSGSSRRPSQPMVYDQRLNPSALFANHEANGSRISMQDQQDYSRPLGVTNPDPRPSFESRRSQLH